MTAGPVPDVGFESHPLRGRANALFFAATGGYIDVLTRDRKQRIFRGVSGPVVEIGPGVGANFRFMPPGTEVIAVEPNEHMHARLRQTAARAGIDLRLLPTVAEATGLPAASAGAVISSLVLCTVRDPEAVVGEIHRVLRPGGRYAFLEHVVAAEGTATRRVQRLVARPWAWAFEGCSCQRDLEPVIRDGGFSRVELERTELRSPFVPANPQISGVAVK
ncbi:MAG TPA: class I SAM-dependent methyltransferase [Candidatus Nanopelagicales bacterium]|nr:class I SAM-dependent methyltransferase [Candidatus Nanopelagicales bacterium]